MQAAFSREAAGYMRLESGTKPALVGLTERMTPQTVARMISTIASKPDEALVFEKVVRPFAQPSWDVDDHLSSDGTVTHGLNGSGRDLNFCGSAPS
jgi:hypothetical protein